MKTSGPADSKSVPGFDNWPRFVGVIEQNRISNYYENYCINSLLTVSLLGTRRTGRKTADRAKNGKLQMVDQSLLPSDDCKKLCK